MLPSQIRRRPARAYSRSGSCTVGNTTLQGYRVKKVNEAVEIRIESLRCARTRRCGLAQQHGRIDARPPPEYRNKAGTSPSPEDWTAESRIAAPASRSSAAPPC